MSKKEDHRGLDHQHHHPLQMKPTLSSEGLPDARQDREWELHQKMEPLSPKGDEEMTPWRFPSRNMEASIFNEGRYQRCEISHRPPKNSRSSWGTHSSCLWHCQSAASNTFIWGLLGSMFGPQPAMLRAYISAFSVQSSRVWETIWSSED